MNNNLSLSRQVLAFLILFTLVVCTALGAFFIDRDFGSITVERVTIPGALGEISAKLYIPKGVSEKNPAPAILCIHGYQNDKETSVGYALELARNGYVAMVIDAYGHGNTSMGLRERGFDKSVKGPDRYKMFMSFSQLNGYSDDIKDSSLGGIDAYKYLRSLSFVDTDRIGLTGHSLGTWAVWTIAAEYPDIAASAVQCGEVYGPLYDADGSVIYKNVLLIQAEYDEFDYFRDYELTVEDLNKREHRYKEFMGQDAPVDWNTTYGSFSEGTARRMSLIPNIHRGITHDSRAIYEAVSWFRQAFDGQSGDIPGQTYMWREYLMLIAMVSSVLATLPLSSLLMRTAFFSCLSQPMPGRYVASPGSWRRFALITILVSAATYPFMTQLGHGLFPYPENIYKALLANGVSVWFITLILIGLAMFLWWFKKGEGKCLKVSWYDLGAAWDEKKPHMDWRKLGKTGLLSLILFAFVYVCCFLSTELLGIEFRFIWPFMRPYTPVRFGQFFLYLPFYAAFFLFNGGVRLFGQFRLKEYESPVKTQLLWWLKNSLLMLGGLVLVALFEYVPFFMGIGPGFDAVGMPVFGGPFMTALIVIVPQFLVLFFAMTYFFRKTGKIYLGGLFTALVATWIVTGGSAIF